MAGPIKALSLAGLAIAVLALPAFAQSRSPACSLESDQAALDQLWNRIRSEKLYEDWTRPECVMLIAKRCEGGWVHASTHEKHTPACGGDPNTIPAIDHFSIQKSTGRILWTEITSGDELPFEFICTRTKCAKSVAPPRSASSP
jgi:hypothetical protein